MIRKTILITATILFICLTFSTCKRDKITCTDDEAFCSLVNNQNFDDTGKIIDNFLATLPGGKDNHEKNLEALKDWLDCKSCVNKAEIFCNSCVKTMPPISEIGIEFNSNGNTIKKTLDILMEDNLRFCKYHL